MKHSMKRNHIMSDTVKFRCIIMYFSDDLSISPDIVYCFCWKNKKQPIIRRASTIDDNIKWTVKRMRLAAFVMIMAERRIIWTIETPTFAAMKSIILNLRSFNSINKPKLLKIMKLKITSDSTYVISYIFRPAFWTLKLFKNSFCDSD